LLRQLPLGFLTEEFQTESYAEGLRLKLEEEQQLQSLLDAYTGETIQDPGMVQLTLISELPETTKSSKRLEDLERTIVASGNSPFLTQRTLRLSGLQRTSSLSQSKRKAKK